MICESCACAGDLTRNPGPFPTAALALATDMHAACPGPERCTCQHRLPTVAQLAERRAARPATGNA